MSYESEMLGELIKRRLYRLLRCRDMEHGFRCERWLLHRGDHR